ncbi:hypothetical protein D3C71_376840 [compost metagenome]
MTTVSASRPATFDEVSAIVHEVYANWLAEKVTCAYDINSGPCCDFAGDVVDLVIERFPGTEIDIEDYEDYLNEDGLTAQGIHYYVKFGNWYFDASRPDGVGSPDYLPTCHSIRICAKSLDDEQTELDEDDELPPGLS